MSSSFSSTPDAATTDGIAAAATPDAKGITIPSYAQIRPYLVQPAKDAIKVINALAPAISAFSK
jgi:hypothetical protein